MRKGLCCFVLIMMGVMAYSQREAANWYFGKNAGLDFNSGTPVPLLDGAINTIEGSETLSDADGNLLFYTDGTIVWNRNHQIMPNGLGLKGSPSTSQSAMVVPNSQNKDIYYVFTPDDALTIGTSSNGFHYSVIDMSRDNSFGDVVEKNVTLLPRCSEKVSAIRNSSGDFYWVVTQYRNQFYSYRVDENGVDADPVISNVGPLIEGSKNIRGNMKISPDGTKLAITHTIVVPEFESSFYLFDFDVETGIVSNSQSVDDKRLYYGVEFSSNSSKLYASGLNLKNVEGRMTLGDMKIVQFDLNEPNLQDSEYVLHSFPNKNDVFVAGGLQIGIDKKIYHSIPNRRLSVIRKPNLEGINVDFRPFNVDLGGQSATFGLPPFIQSYFETIVTIENFCEGEKTTFTTDSTGDIVSISWNFGDPNSGTANLSTELNPTHIFSSFGTYTVTIDVEYINGSSRQFLEFVEIAKSPDVLSEVELVQCDIDGIDDGITTFNLSKAIPLFANGNDDIIAHFFETEADALANNNPLEPIGYTNLSVGQEIFARAFENAECFSIVKVKLTTEPMSDLGDYGTFYICDGLVNEIGTIADMTAVYDQLNAEFATYDEITVYLDSNSALLAIDPMPMQNHTFEFSSPLEVYFRIEQGHDCAFIGKVNLNITQPPEYEKKVQVNLCDGEAQLEALAGFENYLWGNGSTEQFISVNQTGLMDVVFGNGPCLYTQTFEMLPEPEIVIEDIIVEDFNRNNSLEIVLGQDEADDSFLFSIDGGATFQSSNQFGNLLPGIYEIVVENNCSRYEKEVLVGGMPAFFTPNNDGYHDMMTLSNPSYFPNYKMSIFDRYGKLLTSLTENQLGWDGTFLNRDMPADDYWYVLELEDGRRVKGFFSLKR